MTKIIAVNGFKRSGKGETSEAIARNFPGTVKLIGFADALKVLGCQSLGFDRDRNELIELADSLKLEDTRISVEYDDPQLDTEDLDLHDQSGRGFFQELGTRGREVLGSEVWVNIVLPDPASLGPNPLGADAHFRADQALAGRYPGVDCLVITDLRFENEALRVLSLGGEVWEVLRPGTGSDGHASEQPLPRALITRKIANDGTLSELEDKVAVALVEATE